MLSKERVWEITSKTIKESVKLARSAGKQSAAATVKTIRYVAEAYFNRVTKGDTNVNEQKS